MAKYLILINNQVIRDLDNNPIMEVVEGSQKFYSNLKGDTDLEERVEEVLEQVAREERENPLSDMIAETEPRYQYNREFNLKIYTTPLYDLQKQIAENPTATRVAGSNKDLRSLWDKQAYNFYVIEFIKYTQLMGYLENIIRIRRPKMSPFTITHKEHRVMNVLYVNINGLFNPLDTVGFLKNTKLFNKVYVDTGEHSVALMEPTIFKQDIMRGAVTCFFMTSSDIFKLCNIDHKEAISSRDVYRLISAICIKSLPYSPEEGNMDMAMLSLPVGQTIYQITDPDTRVPITYFYNSDEASEYARVANYDVVTLDTDAMFIKSAFPSFKNKVITNTTNLYQEIRGADFVY